MNFVQKINNSAIYNVLYDEHARLRKLPGAICVETKTKVKSFCFVSASGVILYLALLLCGSCTWPPLSGKKRDLLQGWSTRLTQYSQIRNILTTNTDSKRERYVLDTPGCQIEEILPFDARFREIKNAFEVPEAVNCVTTKNNLTSLHNNVLRINHEVKTHYYKNLVKCHYQPFAWNKDVKNDVIWGQKLSINLHEDNKITDEFIWVECLSNNGEIIYGNVHTQIEKKTKNYIGVNIKDRTKERSDQLNVISLGIDSVSRLNFLRHCPKVHDYITKDLGGLALEGFNKVADNTLANVYPMVMGKELMADWKSLMFRDFDDLDWIWKEFAKAGYATLLMEEMIKPYHPTMIPRGFQNRPADHYYRPVRLVTHGMKAPAPAHEHHLRNEFCFNSLDRAGDILNWVEKLAKVYKDEHFFSFTFLSNATHWRINDIARLSEKLLNFFHHLEHSGTLNNTMVILFADHGFRMGGEFFSSYVGAYEARLPMVYFILPKWFSTKYPKAYDNLKTNTRRLTTFYDIHQTLHDVVQNEFPRQHPKTVFKYGTSLFGSVSTIRNCREAGIEPHWCACGAYEDVPVEDPRAQHAARILFDAIRRYNKINITDNQCIDFNSFNLMEAKVKVQGSADGKSRIAKHEISLSIKVQPLSAQFRSTVSLDEGNIPLLGHIERLDNYGSQSDCLRLKNPVIEVTCICKNWRPADKLS